MQQLSQSFLLNSKKIQNKQAIITLKNQIPALFLSQGLNKKINYTFAQDKKPQNDKESSKKQQYDKELQELDTVKSRLVNQLVLQQKATNQTQKSKRDYRDAILFEEILRKEKHITVYDAKGKAYRHNVYLNLGAFLGAMGLFTLFYLGDRYEKKRYWYCVPCILFGLSRIRIYREFQKYYVDKIIYNTESKSFDLYKKSFLGRNIHQELHKNMLLYTQDEYLNNKNINYINMDTLECYQIGYTYAWANQALFSHLLEQRIKSIKK